MHYSLVLVYFLISLVFTLLFYVACSLVENENQKSLFRSSLIICNAMINAIVSMFIFSSGIALLPSLILSLGIFKSISTHKYFHSILSYLNFILPMSWLVVIPGIILFLVNIAMHPFSFARIKKLSGSLQYANIVFSGGAISPRPGYVGFNMGCCTFLKKGAEYVTLHEFGHQLNLAIFGAWFHYIGAIDENFIQKNPCDAYAEKLADSICNPSKNEWSIWAKL